MSDCSSCIWPPCLAIVADRLKTFKKLVSASKGKIRLLPQPYTTPSPPLRFWKPGLSTSGDLYHEICPQKSQTRRHHDIQFRRLCGQMPSLTIEVCHCGQWYIGYEALYVSQMNMLLVVDRLLHRYGDTHIQLHAASYHCCVRLYVQCWNVHPGPYYRWLQLQCRSAQTDVCRDVVSQPGVRSIKRPSFGSIQMQLLRAEVCVEPGIAVVEKVRKMITTSGKCCGIYSKLQITMEWMTVNLLILPKVYPAAHSCKMQVIPIDPQWAVSRSDVVCLFVSSNSLKWTTSDISSLIDIKRKFFDGKVLWWCMSQHIAGILHKTYTKYEVMTYS